MNLLVYVGDVSYGKAPVSISHTDSVLCPSTTAITVTSTVYETVNF